MASGIVLIAYLVYEPLAIVLEDQSFSRNEAFAILIQMVGVGIFVILGVSLFRWLFRRR